MIPGAFAEVPLDGLLQAQFDNHHFMNLFGDQGKGCLRFSYASSIDDIEEAVPRIRRFLKRRNDQGATRASGGPGLDEALDLPPAL